MYDSHLARDALACLWLVYECDVKKAAEQDQHPNAPTKRYPIVCRHRNLAGCISYRSTRALVGTMGRCCREKIHDFETAGVGHAFAVGDDANLFDHNYDFEAWLKRDS